MIALLAAVVHCCVGSLAGSGEALTVLECDTETGAARIVQSVDSADGATYFQVNPGLHALYTVVGESRTGSNLSAFVKFPLGDDGRLGPMKRLFALPCEAPCHVSFSPDGLQSAFAAYGSGTYGIAQHGVGVRSAVLPNDAMGPNADRQQKAYAHCAFFTPDGSRLGVVDLGCDRILFFDPATLARDEAMTIRADPGDGPRHVIWSRDGRFLFVLNELGNSVTSHRFENGRFARIGKWSTLPGGFRDFSKAAAIKLTADGKLLMASNRGHDSIAFFAVSDDGRLTLQRIVRLKGAFPRDFELMPGERFMVVGHKMSDEVVIYRFDRATCTLEPVGEPLVIRRPLCFKFFETK